MKIMRLFKQGVVLASLGVLLTGFIVPQSNAANLSDLIKKTPKLYLPSQVVPGKPATFTVKGKPGTEVQVIMSAMPSGYTLPNGLGLRVGKPIAQQTAKIPLSGVTQVVIDVPQETDSFEKQFVEAVLWTAPDKSDIQTAEIIESSGVAARNNAVQVGIVPDGGSLMLIPGDAGMSSMMRTLGTLNDVSGDERKKKLIYDGTINQDRQIDRTINMPGATPR